MKKSLLKSYANLIVNVGANVQKGQPVLVNASVGNAELVGYIVEEAYIAGASSVRVEWSYQPLTKHAYKYQTVEELSTYPEWMLKKLDYQAETLPAMIYITSEDPDGLKDMDQEKLAKVRAITGPIMMKHREKIDNKYQWTIAGAPSKEWAKKVFPHLSESKAVDALWKAIIDVTRANGDGIKNWNEHNANIIDKCNKLNDLCIKTLTYKSTNGTDFTVGLHDCTKFEGGISKTLNGVTYNPNMPTEECFVSPDKNTANGIVYSTKPLSVMGKLVDKFAFKFENGKIVEVVAENPEHKAVLEKLISLDEGARMLGEVALVPYNSPINQTGLLFYNTLYDENACCHLAIGRGFTDTIKDFDKLTEEEIKAVGLNESMIHVDFMIGSEDLSIVAETYDGKTVQIFENGVWAI